ncbi:MAG: magnesium chelatase [Candidatus Acidiferrales bacterium]
MKSLPRTLGELRKSQYSEERIAGRSVKQEMRENLLKRIQSATSLFPGIHGFDDTVIPQIVNAILSRHHFILLGLRGQAKTRILRALVNLLDEEIPVIATCEIHDNPYVPICRACHERIASEGDATPIAWRARESRYVEKLATPDVTIADMLGDVDPIKAARGGRDLSDELTIHYGLLPRANRGIFAINELPDLAGKIQVGLFNVMQEGDVQIKGYPVRLPLDIALVFTANPEDYTARGKIITPLKDRIGSEIRTHYPATVEEGITITSQEAWTSRDGGRRATIPDYVREIIEQIAFLAREDKRIDRRSGVSQRMPISTVENVLSSAEQRAVRNAESFAMARVADIYAAIPAMTGKFELEYEGELKGADFIARELIRAAIGRVFTARFSGTNFASVVEWFENGGELQLEANSSAEQDLAKLKKIPGLLDSLAALGVKAKEEAAVVTAAAEFALEGLYAHKRINRNEQRGFFAEPRRAPEPRETGPRAPRRQFN